jgi:plastocyanin
MKLPNSARLLGLGVLFTFAACSGDKTAQAADAPADAATAEAPAAAAESAAPAASGTVIEVKTLTDDEGNNKFDPEHITAKKGDVIRFTLVSGVHNFHFTEGPAGATLPAVGQYLQAPGQTEDLVVDLPAGEYKFQCDPHAALGMHGTLTVTE